jgi:hypothetical protein
MSQIEIQVPAELQKKGTEMSSWAESLCISNAKQLFDATAYLQEIKLALRRAKEFFAPMKKSADDAKRAILDAEKKLIGPLEVAEARVKSAALAYNRSQEEIRLKEQQRLQAEADERARREREKLQARAASVKTPEKKEEYAEKAAAVTSPVINVPKPAQPQGTTIRKVWKHRVVNEGLVPRQYLVVDTKALDTLARGLKERAVCPGVEFYADDSLAIRS